MIRRQRRMHLWVWAVLAVVLPVSLAVILALAASTVIERAPVRLEPPLTEGTGG